MSYASISEFNLGMAHLLADLDVPEDLQGLLDRASADLDSFLRWPLPEDPPEGEPLPTTRIPDSALTLWERRCLTQAAIAQAAYRLIQGEDEIAEGRSRVLSVSGGTSITFDAGPVDPIAPSARHALSAAPKLTQYATGIASPDVNDAA